MKTYIKRISELVKKIKIMILRYTALMWIFQTYNMVYLDPPRTDGPPGGRQATISERERAAESNPNLALFSSNRQAKLLAYSLNCAS